MSGSGKPSAPSAAAQGRQDPQSAQVVQHLKETKSGKRMAAGLPLELDPDAPTNVYLNHIAPSKPQDKPSPVSAERKADDPAAKSAPVHADAGSDEADRLRKELEVKTKQLVELRDRLKEFQEIANTYGSFKDLALQLATILKASTAAQETIATLNTQQRTLSEAVAAFQKQFMDATKNPVPRPVVVGDGKPEVRVEIKEVVREVVKEVIKEVPVVKEVRVEVVKEVIKEVPVYIKVETAAAPMPEEKKEPPKEAAIPEALKDEAAKPEAAKVESPKEAPKAAEAAKQAEEKKEDKKEEEKKEPVPKLETQKSRTETTRKKIRGQNSNPPSPKKPPRDASENSPKPGVEKTKSSDRKKHSDSSDVPSPPGSLPASHEGSRIGISQVVPTSPESKEDEERRARHCRESLKELVETERGYVRDLTVLFKTYLQPLQKAQLLTKQDVDAIFPTEDTLMLHTAILAELETALAKPAEQQNVGEVFIKKVDYLKLYTHYCSIQESGTQLLKKLMTDNKKLARALEDARHKPECNKLDLPSYLIKPVQRICKYPLLLREILKNLPPDHKDAKNLQTAHTKVSEIVGLINERSRKAGGGTSGNKVQEILSQISFGATTTFQHRDSRKFVAEARVKMFTPKDGKVWGRQLFVFNDIIVLCRLSTAPGSAKRYKYEETLPFESCLLYDEADRDWEKASGIKNLFRLIRVLDTSSWYFMVKTSDDKKKLMATLRDNMKGAIHDEKLTKLLPDDAVAKAKRMLDGGGSRISRAYMNSPVISSSDRSEKSEKDRISPRRDKRKSVA